MQGQRAQRIEMLLLHEFHAAQISAAGQADGAARRERQNRRQAAAQQDGEDREEATDNVIGDVKAGVSVPHILGLVPEKRCRPDPSALCMTRSQQSTVVPKLAAVQGHAATNSLLVKQDTPSASCRRK